MSADLAPTQELIGEVLAARYRLGEWYWTFGTRHLPAARALQDAGLITTMHGNVERTFRASLTPEGRAHFMSESYSPPNAVDEPPAVRGADVPTTEPPAVTRSVGFCCGQRWEGEHECSAGTSPTTPEEPPATAGRDPHCGITHPHGATKQCWGTT